MEVAGANRRGRCQFRYRGSRRESAVAQLVRRLCTSHTFMNTKYNKWFEQAALDPAHRRVAIAGFTKQRAMLFCCAVVITVCDLMICFTPTHSPSSPTLLAFSAVMVWFIFFRVDSRRRTLTLLDQFDKDRDDKPAA